MAVKEGTGSRRAVEVIKSRGGISKMRCSRDQANTITVPDGKGGFVEKCPTCKAIFVGKPID